MLGDPWSVIVLRDIMFGDRRHFRDLLAGSREGIASNVLASRLRSLVAAGLLTREDARRGQRARYDLTEAGIRTLPVLVALGAWGRANAPSTPLLAVRQRVMEEGGDAFVGDLMDELREAHLSVARPRPDAPRAFDALRTAHEAAV